MTAIDITKTDYPSPSEVAITMGKLQSLRGTPEAERSVGRAMDQLQQFRQLLEAIYTAELNDTSLDQAVVNAMMANQEYT